MASLPTVSVVVPVLNEALCVEACVESLLAQDYDPAKLEIIFVDNGSTDRTARILSAYRQRLVLLEEKIPGPAAARNAGIKAASGQVIAFTDADCVASKDWLSRLVPDLCEAGVGLVGGPIKALPPATPIEQFSEILDDHERSLNARLPMAITMNWASWRSDILALGAFDPEFRRGEDSDLSLRMHFAGLGFRYCPGAVVYHRNEDSLGKLTREGYQQGVAAVHLARKHCERLDQLGVPRFHWRGYIELLRYLVRALNPRKRPRALCALCFHSGRKAGTIAGSIRYRHLRL